MYQNNIAYIFMRKRIKLIKDQIKLRIFSYTKWHYTWYNKIVAGKARECRMESDCAGIQNTTCMADPRDGRTRCLCGDYSPPINGACINKFKGKPIFFLEN